MDKSWIRKPRHTHEYYAGVQQFLDFAISNAIDGVNILCPCPKCNFKKWKPRGEVNQHLLAKAFPSSYDVWNLHGELITDFGASTSILEPELIIHDQEATPPLLVEEQPVLEPDLFQNMVNDAMKYGSRMITPTCVSMMMNSHKEAMYQCQIYLACNQMMSSSAY